MYIFKIVWRPPDISIELTKYKYLNYLSFFFFLFLNIDFFTYPGTGPERTRETFFGGLQIFFF